MFRTNKIFFCRTYSENKNGVHQRRCVTAYWRPWGVSFACEFHKVIVSLLLFQHCTLPYNTSLG